MQNEIYSYSFPLFDNAYNAFIASFKSKQLLLGGPISAEKSVMNLFNYEDQNLKKSLGVNKTIEGRLTQLVVGDNMDNQLALAVVEKQSLNHLMVVNREAFSKEDGEICSSIHSQEDTISSVALKPDLTLAYLAGNKDISIFDLEKRSVSESIAHHSENVEHLTLDPNNEMITFVSNRNQVKVLDKKSKAQKYVINGPGAKDIVNIDYNPNKQNCLLTCHHESIKFWDLRKGGLPFKIYDNHHNLLTQAKYNHSHDELIACGYDDGSVGLLRLVSASSSTEVDVEDSLVRLYDEHEDSVLSVEWGKNSAWTFVSVSSSPTLLVLNVVPNAEKYRILL